LFSFVSEFSRLQYEWSSNSLLRPFISLESGWVCFASDWAEILQDQDQE
jgi:hypothetical protein